MLNVTISVPDAEKLGKAFKSVDMLKLIVPVIDRMAMSVLGASKRITPVGDTGFLKNRQDIANKGSARIISTHVPYARFVHDGTRKMRARPFMKQGVDFAVGAWKHGKWNVELESNLVKQLKTL